MMCFYLGYLQTTSISRVLERTRCCSVACCLFSLLVNWLWIASQWKRRRWNERWIWRIKTSRLRKVRSSFSLVEFFSTRKSISKGKCKCTAGRARATTHVRRINWCSRKRPTCPSLDANELKRKCGDDDDWWRRSLSVWFDVCCAREESCEESSWAPSSTFVRRTRRERFQVKWSALSSLLLRFFLWFFPLFT